MSYAVEPVVEYIRTLQERFITELSKVDSGLTFVGDLIEGERGTSRPRVAEGGNHVDKVAVQCTHSGGQDFHQQRPNWKPKLANTPFQAVAISWMFHPKNPYVPTTETYDFSSQKKMLNNAGSSGFDLTPYYGFESDAIHWHSERRCEPGDMLYLDSRDSVMNTFIFHIVKDRVLADFSSKIGTLEISMRLCGASVGNLSQLTSDISKKALDALWRKGSTIKKSVEDAMSVVFSMIGANMACNLGASNLY